MFQLHSQARGMSLSAKRQGLLYALPTFPVRYHSAWRWKPFALSQRRPKARFVTKAGLVQRPCGSSIFLHRIVAQVLISLAFCSMHAVRTHRSSACGIKCCFTSTPQPSSGPHRSAFVSLPLALKFMTASVLQACACTPSPSHIPVLLDTCKTVAAKEHMKQMEFYRVLGNEWCHRTTNALREG